MKLLELFEDLLLAACVTILLPLATYWGINVFYANPQFNAYVVAPIDTPEHKEQTLAWENDKAGFERVICYGALLIGVLAIIAGTLIGVPRVATGLIGGGVSNVIMALFFTPSSPVIKFMLIFLTLIVLITVMFIKKQR